MSPPIPVELGSVTFKAAAVLVSIDLHHPPPNMSGSALTNRNRSILHIHPGSVSIASTTMHIDIDI